MRPAPSPEEWQRIENLFAAAAALAPDDRQPFLDREDPDPEVRREVEALLAADTPSGGQFLTDLVGRAAEELTAEHAQPWVGRTVGHYRLLEEIARGGMGTVYLAERADAAYEAKVAIKFVRGGIAGPDLARRFVSERQILADLRHPNIARLLDGGTTPDGTPYLVMDHIDGDPIDAYADRHELDVRARLTLFAQVCDAVQHAHARLVVHRDIKPSNIMVTPDGTPKLLDFGVAKLLDQGDPIDITETGWGPLTPAYASPEQLTGDPITTATDIYSLGTLLYLLLTGNTPFRRSGKKGVDLVRAVLEEPIEPPSRAAAATGAPLHPLDRDIDAIVLTALAREPERRYISAERLAEDVRRYLEGRPVRAHPDSRAYRLRKFFGRHRVEAVGAAGAVALLVGVTAFYTNRLARERDFALAQQQQSAQIAAFLERLFLVSDPSEARGETITAREVLDSAVAHLPGQLGTQPEVRAAMLYTLGGVYHSLGLTRDARPLLEQGLALRRAHPGAGSPSVGALLHRLGKVETAMGQFDSAAVTLADAVRRLADERTPAAEYGSVEAQLSLVDALRRAGRLDEADSVSLEAIDRARAQGSDSIAADALHSRAALLISQRRGPEAVPIAREAWERRRALRDEDDPEVITALNNLGQAYYLQTDYEAAQPIMEEVLARRRRILGEEHPLTGTAWNNLAALHQSQGRPEAGIRAAERALAIYRAAYGEQHQRVALVKTNLGSMLTALGRLDEAEAMHRSALATMRAILRPGHVDIAVSFNNLANVLEQRGRLPEAEAMYRAALDEYLISRSEDGRTPATFLANIGRVVDAQGRTAEAETLLRRALELQRKHLPEQHARTATTLTLLGDLLTRDGRAAAAEPLLREALAMRQALLAEDHWGIQVTRSVLGACLGMLGKREEAERHLTESAAALRELLGAEDGRAQAAAERLERFRTGRTSPSEPDASPPSDIDTI